MDRSLLSRRTGRAAAAGGLALLAVVGPTAAGLSAPASAAVTSASTVSAEAGAAAVRLSLHLPAGLGLPAGDVELVLDLVSGRVSAAPGSSPAAVALADIASGRVLGQEQAYGSTARLPAPRTASSDPAGPLNTGIAGSPLADLLSVELAPSSAAVTTDPSSRSRAQVAALQIGLPADLATALVPVTTALSDAATAFLTALAAATVPPVTTVCGNLDPVHALLALPDTALNPILATLPGHVTRADLTDAAINGACALPATLTSLRTALAGALGSLTGPGGLLDLGLVTSAQSITRGSRVTATATTEITGLTALGHRPLAGLSVLTSTSRASVDGSRGGAQASVDSSVATLRSGTRDPLAALRATVAGITGQVAGIELPAGVAAVLADLLATVNDGLAGGGVTVVNLDQAARVKALTVCPAGLTDTQKGTFRAADGSCAAAATQGVGISVSLPAALADAVGLDGPLVTLSIVPSGAVARARSAAATPGSVPVGSGSTPGRTLASTGGPLEANGLAATVLVGLALAVRRRRSTV
jgi:hypothetical protein